MAQEPDRYAALREIGAAPAEHKASVTPEIDSPASQSQTPADIAGGLDAWKGHPGAALGWTDQGGMERQQTSALAWVKAKAEEHDRGQNAEPAVEPEKARELVFFEDRAESRDYGSLKLEHANSTDQERDREPAQEQEAQRSLVFFEDRNRDQGLSR